MEKLLSFLKQPSIISAVVIIIFTIVWDIWRNKPKLKFKRISIHKGIKEWIMEVYVVNNGNKPISNIYASVDIKDLFNKTARKYEQDLSIYKLYVGSSPPGGVAFRHKTDTLDPGRNGSLYIRMKDNEIRKIIEEKRLFFVKIIFQSPVLKRSTKLICYYRKSKNHVKIFGWQPSLIGLLIHS